MNVQKISISVSQEQFDFINDYRVKHHCKSNSEVICKALRLLQIQQLESRYLEANHEIDDDFESTDMDGIEDNEAL